MRELDFDELDRAVNTLMGGVAPSAPVPSATDNTNVITIPSTLGDAPSLATPLATSRFTSPGRPIVRDTATADAPDASATEDVSPVAERPDTPDVLASRLTIPSRRAGRFMDVVHPSSDMKNPSNAPSERPTRTAVSIAPLPVAEPATGMISDSQVTEDEVIEAPYPVISEPDTIAESAPDMTVVATVEPASVTLDTISTVPESTHEWPDPLAGFDTAPVIEPTIVDDMTVAADEPVIAIDEDEAGDDDLFMIDTTEPEDEPEPLTSPFLTDAKVDKRPLGTASDLSASEPGRAPVLGVHADQVLTNSDPDDQLPPEPVTAVQPLPAELQDDLIAVESDNTSFSAPQELPADSVAVETATVQPSSPVSTDSEPAAATGPTSIQQQYKESAATGDQTNGAIYDTQAYHQPLAHPVKKKSGWMWVIWVMLLLIVGAGGAVALYYFKII